MKTTLDLPDDLMRAVKIKAAEDNRRLKDIIADLIRRGLSTSEPTIRHRAALPIIRGGRPAAQSEEITPERAAELLMQEEEDRVLGR